MPAYLNNTTHTIYAQGEKIAPGQTVETLKLLDHPDIEKVSDEPWYRLCHSPDGATILSGSGAGEVTYHIINAETQKIWLKNTSDIALLIKPNGTSNPYGIKILPGEELWCTNDHNIHSFVISHDSDFTGLVIREIP